MLARTMRSFTQAWPAIEVSIRDLLLGGVGQITQGYVDVAFTRLLPGQVDLEVEILAEEPRVVAVPTRLPGQVAAEAASIQEIITLVASGRRVCILPALAASHSRRPDVSHIPVRDAEPAVVSLAWRRGSSERVAQAFIDCARLAAGPSAPRDDAADAVKL